MTMVSFGSPQTKVSSSRSHPDERNSRESSRSLKRLCLASSPPGPWLMKEAVALKPPLARGERVRSLSPSAEERRQEETARRADTSDCLALHSSARFLPVILTSWSSTTGPEREEEEEDGKGASPSSSPVGPSFPLAASCFGRHDIGIHAEWLFACGRLFPICRCYWFLLVSRGGSSSARPSLGRRLLRMAAWASSSSRSSSATTTTSVAERNTTFLVSRLKEKQRERRKEGEREESSLKCPREAREEEKRRPIDARDALQTFLIRFHPRVDDDDDAEDDGGQAKSLRNPFHLPRQPREEGVR